MIRMNKKGNMQIVAIIIFIVLVLLALGIIKMPFGQINPHIEIINASSHNLSYGNYNGATITLDLINPRSEAINVNWVMEYDSNLLQVNYLSQQVSFGMIVPQYLYAGEHRRISLGVAQIKYGANQNTNLTIYLCETNKCLSKETLSENLDKKTISFNLGY